MTQATAEGSADERLARRDPLRRLLVRPEFGALIGAVALFVLFSVTADAFLQTSSFSNVLYSASTFGIMAVGVSLLMIGGEFDLSAGVMVISSALVASLVSFQLTLNVWAGVAISLVVTLALGVLNGVLYVWTRLPSFIVTLATFLMLAGANLGVTKAVTGNVASDSIGDMDGFQSAKGLFASEVGIGGVNVKVTVFWWIGFTAVATWILLRTRAGNWIFAVGGNADSARAVGVPVARTKIALFAGVAFCAWFSGMHLLFAFPAIQSGEGIGNEFFYIICAVIGGCLLTGGYGSAIGAAIGAFIYGMVNQGIVYAGWNPDWFRFFLGAALLAATVLNHVVRRRAER
ncbi:ABC transporter permease [Actinomadura harenae]|uniref:Xylose transport system permease protein XylH n=1 Tax=Actinomadura harenae TaxID=2483351 RepID=A0A3M2LJ11_9ACTN|nr:ABC transporter permease [Actinomadura harenae]RMI37106.1 ABC transporter permease [Actinomadura harenae]